MRTCVIFNPTARGDKARRFRRHLDEVAARSELRLTRSPGDAGRLATQAVEDGFDTIVAAGGDGTVNEVLNGLAAAPGGLERARLAVLPLGTVNVFARELGIPGSLKAAWEIVLRGSEAQIDLPRAETRGPPALRPRYFAQLAGAGLDARAIELVHYPLKRRIGPLAYLYAGLKALSEKPGRIVAEAGGDRAEGGLVLIGNGRLYGGPYRLFPDADLRDGLLEACVFPRVNWMTLARCGPNLLLGGQVPKSSTVMLRGPTVSLAADGETAFEVDGEWAGRLPVSFSIAGERLRVVVP